MAESRDDAKLAAHYRALATEAPSAVLDEAIRAAARRAVSSAPQRRASRWTVPVSIAAVLVLSFGVTLRMQQEQPGIESVAPAAPAPAPLKAPVPSEVAKEDRARPDSAKALGRAQPPAADLKEKKREAAPAAIAPAPKLAAPPTPKVAAQTAPAPQPTLQAEAPRAQESLARPAAPAPGPAAAPPASRLAEPAPVTDAAAAMPAATPAPSVAAAQAPQKPAASAFVPAPAVTVDTTTRPQAPRDSAPAERAALESNVAPGRRDEAAGAAAGFMAKRSKAADDAERELERIAQLRRDGRDREADEALAKFRREHPDYTIKPEVWERVKPR